MQRRTGMRIFDEDEEAMERDEDRCLSVYSHVPRTTLSSLLFAVVIRTQVSTHGCPSSASSLCNAGGASVQVYHA
eukprot:6269789-Amphidinium_carterae.1